LSDPKALYSRRDDDRRRKMNQVVYKKLYVVGRRITMMELNEPFDALIQAQNALNPSSGQTEATYFRTAQNYCRIRVEGAARESLTALLLDHGLNKALMVEVKGFEPSASTLRT
jgi:hypothetical protein